MKIQAYTLFGLLLTFTSGLAEDPQFAAAKARLIEALTDMQERTRDPFLDPRNVEAFVAEQLANRDLSYRRKQDFRWSYLETFPVWRADVPPPTPSGAGSTPDP